MKLHIKITDEKMKKAIKEIAKRQVWSFNKLGQIALKFYLKARKKIK